MSIAAGELNRRIRIERRGTGTDGWGQPIEEWALVGEVWAGIGNETGMGAIRSSLQGNVPASIARYSFLVRFQTAQALAIDQGMRIVHDGLVFDIKGVTRDLKDRERAYILAEQGGNNG
ncbi:phage head closure protein [Stenotrophomonas sp. HITSZ_GD]|uniref:phage head closure protein n=1 Tax=Stenotrophomonas sp. HITSZ_GD TaxID=3037248 RepID=UPI00240E6A98|nr:phage head closure protein [Stenotrophomonas sp. HITSZ_GD]MDG2524644.1 phage head closure protein [Stenotrophomonas sp. HITSZ_GD]